MKGVFFDITLPDLCEVRDFPIPTPDKGEVLVKNVSVASNPKDWMVPAMIPGYASIEGSDIAGVVDSVGEGVTNFKKGDRVAAFTKMMSGAQYGAYAGNSPVICALYLRDLNVCLVI
jgi:NADPH:quinone reductase-like Zn-dependent oxidoreductase